LSDTEPRGHFVELLMRSFVERAERVAVRWKQESVSYGELGRRAAGVAALLAELGLRRGDRVVLYTRDKWALMHAHLGTILAGGVSLPLNYRFTREEMAYFLADSRARFIVAGLDEMPVVRPLAEQCPDLDTIISVAALLAAPPSALPHTIGAGADDPGLMLYSSGTTGQPKGAVHTHANLGASLLALKECWRFTEEDVLLNVLPLFHIHGLSFAMHLSLISGSEMVLEEAFHPIRTLELIGQATVFMGIPTFYYFFMDMDRFTEAASRWQRPRLFTCGSAPIRPEALPRLEETLRRPVINRYGMTETHVITSLPLDGPARQGSVGLPLSGIEMRVVDDERRPCPPGRVGEVFVKGPNLFSHYWNKPEATQEAFEHEGYFATGDLGSVDEDGFLTLVGRKKDLIITSGFNVYPPVVERALGSCPGVKESAVFGIPDDKRGERVAAAIVRSDPGLDERTVAAFCREKLVDYQRPAVIVFLDELPRNTMGKVLKRQLRERDG